MGRAIKWFIYQKDLLMVLALEDSIFSYKCRIYNKESEGGIIWNDPVLNIEWPIENLTFQKRI
jgi:dTDP-4-dehydrorhamnose 3,5-epimerase-like enzyme